MHQQLLDRYQNLAIRHHQHRQLHLHLRVLLDRLVLKDLVNLVDLVDLVDLEYLADLVRHLFQQHLVHQQFQEYLEFHLIHLIHVDQRHQQRRGEPPVEAGQRVLQGERLRFEIIEQDALGQTEAIGCLRSVYGPGGVGEM